MKDNNYILTLRETEELCRLYMDCRLSVQEEIELQYVLGQLEYSSPLIDDVRMMMDIQSSVVKNGSRNDKGTPTRKILWLKPFYIGIAASLAVLVGIGLSLNHAGPTYVAYADGNRLDDRQAMIQVEADMKKTEYFMEYAAELEARERQKCEHIMNLKSFEL